MVLANITNEDFQIEMLNAISFKNNKILYVLGANLHWAVAVDNTSVVVNFLILLHFFVTNISESCQIIYTSP